MRGLKKVYFRTLELLGGFVEIPLFLTPWDEVKPTFLSQIRHFFEETGWSKALPHIFCKVRARDRVRLHTGP
jgi:hypothetical protein